MIKDLTKFMIIRENMFTIPSSVCYSNEKHIFY